MSIYGSMVTAISGLNAQTRRIGHISDNIANVSTISYKKVGTNFSALVTQSSKQTHEPGGVVAHPQYNVALQGSIEASGQSTHLAVNGNGFFAVKNFSDDNQTAGIDRQLSYTRKGDFEPDATGNLVNSSGFFLQGWRYNTDGVTFPSKELTTVNIGNITGNIRTTTNAVLGANLPASQAGGETRVTPAATTSIANQTLSQMFSEQVYYDDLGRPRTMRIEWYATGADTADPREWTVQIFEVEADGTPADDGAGVPTSYYAWTELNLNNSGSTSGTLSSDQTTGITNGSHGGAGALVASVVNGEVVLTLAGSTFPGFADNITIKLGEADNPIGITQFSDDFAITNLSQDGLPYGQYEGVSVDGQGDVYAHYGNGVSEKIYRVPMITFANPDGLQLLDGGVYRATVESGDPVISDAGVGRAGEFVPEALEASNVDIAEEFTQMIQAQRAYSANSRVITTSDQMLEEVINLKR
ncbi:MAG: flagellar hook protein FlgE [Rhodospirillaceae bacterium]|nr:flagellar hook protein FlgE [Rhodospirillaceae bacterium]